MELLQLLPRSAMQLISICKINGKNTQCIHSGKYIQFYRRGQPLNQNNFYTLRNPRSVYMPFLASLEIRALRS